MEVFNAYCGSSMVAHVMHEEDGVCKSLCGNAKCLPNHAHKTDRRNDICPMCERLENDIWAAAYQIEMLRDSGLFDFDLLDV